MTPERLAELRGRVERGELGCGPKTAALVHELLAEYDALIMQEVGAVAVACDALGVSADAVRATALSRARGMVGMDYSAALSKRP